MVVWVIDGLTNQIHIILKQFTIMNGDSHVRGHNLINVDIRRREDK